MFAYFLLTKIILIACRLLSVYYIDVFLSATLKGKSLSDLLFFKILKNIGFYKKFPAGIYLLKGNNGKMITMCKIC